MIDILIPLAIGIALGAAGYRYMLKRDPATLERWAAEAKKLGDHIEDRIKP